MFLGKAFHSHAITIRLSTQGRCICGTGELFGQPDKILGEVALCYGYWDKLGGAAA